MEIIEDEYRDDWIRVIAGQSAVVCMCAEVQVSAVVSD